jgi:hypothetical protein
LSTLREPMCGNLKTDISKTMESFQLVNYTHTHTHTHTHTNRITTVAYTTNNKNRWWTRKVTFTSTKHIRNCNLCSLAEFTCVLRTRCTVACTRSLSWSLANTDASWPIV